MSDQISFQFTFQPDHPCNMWVLQLGGWLPIQFSGVGVMLVDRNVTAAMSKLLDRPDRTDMAAEKWWLSQLNSERYSLNSFLCASEGNLQKPPTLKEFRGEIEKANDIVSRSLPLARIVSHSPQDIIKSYEIVNSFFERQQREVKFLSEIAPLLASRVSRAKTEGVERLVIQAAHSETLSLRSLVVLAALSCLYEPQDGKEPLTGRGVLKLKPKFSSADAYNALSDIRSLEFLVAASGLPSSSVGFCTRDRDLAAFWVGLEVSAPRSGGNKVTAELAPSARLFPRLSEDEGKKLLIRFL